MNAPSRTTTAPESMTLHFGPTVTLVNDAYSPRQYRAFEIVNPKAWGRKDWKEEISAVLHPKDLETADVSIEDVIDAVQYYTATEATVRKVEVHAEPGVFAFVVKAPGYRAGPAH